jgi:signal transduction histidine kinase
MVTCRISGAEGATVYDNQTIDACMAERERIGQEIHDTILQDIAAALIVLKPVLSQAEAREAPEANNLATALTCLERASRDLRRITQGLLTFQLDSSEIPQALELLCQDATKHHGVACQFHAPPPGSDLPPQSAPHLYCITKEALSNAIRHGGATDISVTLSVTEGSGILTVEDNGIGYEHYGTPHRGLGLRIMQRRAQLLNGELTLRRNDAAGTTIYCTFGASGDTLET